MFAQFSNGQIHPYPDTLNKKRAIITSSAIGVTWVGSMTGLYQLWYKETTQSKFHTFDDSKNWLQMDKIGHTFTAWRIGDLTGELFLNSGIPLKKASIYGGLIGLGYQSTLEIFDGFSEDWGFSWSDMAANTIGAIAYSGQQYFWQDQRFKMKFSYHPTEYAAIRPEILGNNAIESLFKDYNGQTYWISFSPVDFFPQLKIPNWINLSLGYSADAKLKGDSETYIYLSESNTPITYKSKREYLLSLDFDLSRIPCKRKWIHSILKQVNHLKIPFPALRFSNGITYGHWIYF